MLTGGTASLSYEPGHAPFACQIHDNYRAWRAQYDLFKSIIVRLINKKNLFVCVSIENCHVSLLK